MTTVMLTPDIEKSHSEQARQQGTTPGMLALDGLRKLFAADDLATDEGQARETTFNLVC